jgi:hypothetical protein
LDLSGLTFAVMTSGQLLSLSNVGSFALTNQTITMPAMDKPSAEDVIDISRCPQFPGNMMMITGNGQMTTTELSLKHG